MDTFTAHIDGGIKDLRLVRKSFVQGRENSLSFTHPDVWQAYREAREAAKFFAGLNSLPATIPYVSDRGPMVGRVVGSRNPAGTIGWRIDWAPDKDLHVNWWDHTNDHLRRDKSVNWSGANCVAGGNQDLYWQIIQHFPDPLWSRV